MARRATKTPSSKSPSHRSIAEGPADPTIFELQTQLAQLEQIRSELEIELMAARNKIRDLERRHGEIANRVAWALDSLRDIVGDE